MTDIQRVLKDFFGYDTFKGDQEQIIRHLVGGGDAFVLMPTGGGKSLCYQLPALVMEGTAVVISPLIALMKNQVDAIRGFVSERGSIAHFLNSSLNRQQLDEVKKDLIDGKTKILYVAPESLTKEENIAVLKEIKVSFYAIDEAHCISEWGHDFRPEYRRIRALIDDIGRRPIIALTATATPKVQSDILKNLGITGATVFKSSFNRPNLLYEIRDKLDADKDIVRYIRQNAGKSGIVYCLSRKKVEEFSEYLCVNGIKARPYHAGLDSRMRAENQDAFINEDIDVIVATIAFGMGIDKPDVRFVIHYDIPKSIESYYQETGRAGRDGLEGRCIAYYSYKDVQKLEKFMQGKPVSEQEIGRQLLDEVVSYAESGECRRKLLLHYFGEQYSQECCGMCDNCISPSVTYDGREDMLLVIRLVKSLPEHFKTEHLANILKGETDALVESYHHDTLDLFGEGADKSVAHWTSVIRQGVIRHLLGKEIESYGLIYVTPEGEDFLRNSYPLHLVVDRERVYAQQEDEDSDAGDDERFSVDPSAEASQEPSAQAADPVLFKMLKDLRKDMARRLGLQPWHIFMDPALSDMTTFYPITPDELVKCQGVGRAKADKFGSEFLKLIRRYVEENEIMRPDDFVIKSNPNKPNRNISIIEKLDRRLSLEDIAAAEDIEMEELLRRIESIVSTGTKVRLDYYINDNIDSPSVERIMDYFREEAESDSIEEAEKVLCEEGYEPVEIRLVRIKFLCEVAS